VQLLNVLRHQIQKAIMKIGSKKTMNLLRKAQTGTMANLRESKMSNKQKANGTYDAPNVLVGTFREQIVILLGKTEKSLFSVTLLEYTNESVNLRQASSAVLLIF
jgi:hypothetical protein